MMHNGSLLQHYIAGVLQDWHRNGVHWPMALGYTIGA